MGNGKVVRERRVTRPRMLIERLMANAHGFVTAQEVAAMLRAEGTAVGTTTVYRNLREMADLGNLDVIHIDGEARYRSCLDRRHHHHIVCRSCGTTVEVEIPGLEQWIDAAASKLHYTQVGHHLEIVGLCPRCAAHFAAVEKAAD